MTDFRGLTRYNNLSLRAKRSNPAPRRSGFLGMLRPLRSLAMTPLGAGEPGFRFPVGRAERGGAGERRIGPRLGIGEQRGEQAAGMGVARAHAAEPPDERAAGE